MSDKSTFTKDLQTLINKASLENESDTPDFILAEYLTACLITYNETVKKRDKWFGVDMWAKDKLATRSNDELYEPGPFSSDPD